MTLVCSYLRVSTAKQGEHGLGIDAQRKAVSDYIRDHPETVLLKEFVEVESGKLEERPQLGLAMALCKERAAVLLVAKLDRLARNLFFIESIRRAGVEFIAADMPHANKLTVQIMGVMAEHERDMISERTKAALRAARERGTILGGPRPAPKATREHAALLRPVIADLKSQGITKIRDICEWLNAHEFKSTKQGHWHVASVHRLLKRLKNETQRAGWRSAFQEDGDCYDKL